jgi:hypothetical protein
MVQDSTFFVLLLFFHHISLSLHKTNAQKLIELDCKEFSCTSVTVSDEEDLNGDSRLAKLRRSGLPSTSCCYSYPKLNKLYMELLSILIFQVGKYECILPISMYWTSRITNLQYPARPALHSLFS